MKKWFVSLFVLVLVLAGCSKDEMPFKKTPEEIEVKKESSEKNEWVVEKKEVKVGSIKMVTKKEFDQKFYPSLSGRIMDESVMEDWETKPRLIIEEARKNGVAYRFYYIFTDSENKERYIVLAFTSPQMTEEVIVKTAKKFTP